MSNLAIQTKHDPHCDCGICAYCNGQEDVNGVPSGWIYEDQLGSVTRQFYDAWFARSRVIDGVRMGPPLSTIEPPERIWLAPFRSAHGYFLTCATDDLGAVEYVRPLRLGRAYGLLQDVIQDADLGDTILNPEIHKQIEAELELSGWRRCDIAACNCGGWHDWKS